MKRAIVSSLIAVVGISGAIALWPRAAWQAEEVVEIPVATTDESEASKSSVLAFSDIPSDRNGTVFKQVMQRAKTEALETQSFGTIVQSVAEQLLGASYVDGLLDRAETEELVLSLTEFDCVLFVETVLAMARSIVERDYTYAGFGDRVETQRYRNGDREDYCSRLHYFSEWIEDNQRRNYLASAIPDLQEQPLDKTLNFMTEHRSKYRHLARNDKNFKCISEMETQLQHLAIQYVPTVRVREQYAAIQAGDVIAIATDITGIDVTHSGLAYAQADGSMGFIHAAPGRGVIVAEDLQRYVERVPNAIGILVARPNANS